jgi:hypothetical protein
MLQRADEIASTDLNVQTIWDMIKEVEQESEGTEYENFASGR